MDEERTYGVAELAGLIGRVVAQAFPGTMWVQGQIRNLSRSANGHVYFDLAEPGPLGAAPAALVPVTLLASDKQQVNAVMKSGGAGRIEDGVEVRIAGRLNWFTPRGRLQLRMTGIDPSFTLGRLLEDRDRLLAKLRADGLLARNRTVPLPIAPMRVGLVTSLGSAAHADFVHELELSGFAFALFEIDARTQGLDAGRQVAAAIATAVKAGAEVVAVVRGGGSRTDLAPFDGEAIARAIAGCPVPVFTGIGHELDRSIADEVAHSAFKTPTACAAGLVDQVVGSVADESMTCGGRSPGWPTRPGRQAADRLDSSLVAAGPVHARRPGHRRSGARRPPAPAAPRRRARPHARRAAPGQRRDPHPCPRPGSHPGPRLVDHPRRATGWVVRSSRRPLAPGQELVTTFAEGSVTSTVTATDQEPTDHG